MNVCGLKGNAGRVLMGLWIVASVVVLSSCGESSDSSAGGGGGGGGTLEAARLALEAGDAAPVYEWCFAQKKDHHDEAFMDVEFSYETMDAGARAALAELKPVIDWATAASAAPRCEFELDLSQGIGGFYPHMGKMRNLSYILRSDTIRLAADGDFEEAANRVTTIVRMANQMGDRFISEIEWLVAIGLGSLATSLSDDLVEAGAHKPAKQKLLAALSLIDRADPMKASQAIRREGEMSAITIRAGLMNDEIEKLAPGTDPDELAGQVQKMYAALSRAWPGSGGTAKMRAVLSSSQFAPIAAFAPDVLMLKAEVEAGFQQRLAAAIANVR